MLLILLSEIALYGQSIKSQEARRARLEREIAVLDRQLSENKVKSMSALEQLSLVQSKLSVNRELLNQSAESLRDIENRIKEKSLTINNLQAGIDSLQQYYSRLLRAVYKNRDAKIWYMYIMSGENLSQAIRRYTYFKNISSSLNEQARKLKQSKEVLEEEQIELQRIRNEAAILRARHESSVRLLKQEEEKANKLVDTLRKDRRKYEGELASKRKQVENLNREIERLISESMGGGRKESVKKSVDYVLASEFSKNKGKLPWPADGTLTERFGQRYHPVFKTVKLPFNNGINIVLASAAEVRAVFDGVVKQIVVMPGYNKCVLVQHGNYFTFYCKLQTVDIKPGDRVKTGQRIGSIATINGVTELHFQLWQNQTPQNPESWLRPR